MPEIKEESKCLASLAVFRELYNNERDIYSIICEFLKEVISSNSKHQFTLTEITQLFNDAYDFSIPEAVIGTSLNRFGTSLSKSHGVYTITNQAAFAVTGKLTGSHLEIQSNNEAVINDLIEFIEIETNTILSEDEKEKVVQSFCSFIIEESTNQQYSEFISAFIVKEKKDTGFINRLNKIKEGVVLYTGIKYNTNLNELGAWTTELTIYIETEILFHLAGYNGVLCQVLFEDFFKYVTEINDKSIKKSGKKLIQLKFFVDVKDEIERFFKKAEYIVSGKDKANPSKTAMTSIINGCSSPAEVIEKKINFYNLIKTKGITEDDYTNYYSEHNHRFNIEDQDIIKSISMRTGIEDVHPYLKYLNFINVHRRGISNRGFENVGYLLLSGTSNTIVIAWDEAIKPNGSVPLASNLSFLTNKLWFRLNKGFGSDSYPKTFDIVTKAQIVLSTQVNNSVAEKFEELQGKFKDGLLTEEQAISSIAELRRQAKKPEDIEESGIHDILQSIDESSIESYLKEQELFKTKATKQEIENKKLKQSIDTLEQERRKKELEHQEEIKKKNLENKVKELELEKYREAEFAKEERKRKRKKIIKKCFVIFSIILIAYGSVLLYRHYNEILGILTGTISGMFGLATFFGVDFKSINKHLKDNNN